MINAVERSSRGGQRGVLAEGEPSATSTGRSEQASLERAGRRRCSKVLKKGGMWFNRQRRRIVKTQRSEPVGMAWGQREGQRGWPGGQGDIREGRASMGHGGRLAFM